VEGNPAVHRLGVRERAEHLITLADAAEPEPWHVEHRWATGHHVASEKEVVCGDFSCGPDPLANAEFVAAARTEAVWVARQLLEALNRIDQLEAENEDLKRSGPTFGGDAKISGYHSTSEPLNPKEADE
jgi:hypothetical protein